MDENKDKSELELVQNDKPEQHGISINVSSDDELDDKDIYVSPKKEVFQKASNKDKPGDLLYWHDSDGEKSDEFNMSDAYSRTSQTDKKFREAFGQPSSRSHEKQAQEDEEEQLEIEYTDRMQRKEIIGMYKYAKRSITIKLIFALIFSAVVLFVENAPSIFLGLKESWEYFDAFKHPYIHTLVSLFGTVFCAIFAYEQLYHGTKSIFKRSLIPESVASVALITSLLNTLLQLISISVFSQEPILFNFPTTIIIVATILYSYINIARERYGFGVVSAKDSKFFLEKVNEDDAEAEFDTFTNTINGEFNGEIARVGRASFIRNYFANTNAPVNLKGFLRLYYFLVIGISAIFAIIAMFKGMNLAESITYMAVSVLALLPVGTLFTYSVPFFLANNSLYESEVAIIGENAIEAHSKMNVVAVNDTTAFPPSNVKLTYFNVYNEFTMEKVIYYAASGFSVVGGPLADVFDAATNNSLPKSRQVKFVCAGRSYLCVDVDGNHIIFADKFGMTAQGIEVGSEREEKDNVAVMYTACNGILCAKMYLKYQIDEEFVLTAQESIKNGISIGIRTFDPNISNDLLAKLTGFDKQDVKVIKLGELQEISAPAQSTNATVVSKGRSSALLKALPMCKRIVKIRKVIKAIKIIASLTGAVYIGFCVFGAINLLPSVSIALFYLAFAVIMLLLTLAMLPKKK